VAHKIVITAKALMELSDPELAEGSSCLPLGALAKWGVLSKDQFTPIASGFSMIYKSISTKAFTIIEFLIVFGIIGVVTTLSIASYNTFTESFKLKNEVQNATAVLSLAQKRAVAGEDVCTGCSFDSFIVTFTSDAGYTMQGQYTTDVAPSTKVPYGSPVVYSIDPVNKNISILTSVSTAYSVTFSKLTGAPDSAKIIQFKNASKNECSQIDISAVGLISSTNITCP